MRDLTDAALLLFGRAPGPAVIVECAQIPFAVPCGSFDRGRERVGAPIPAITKPGLIFVETVPREISDGRDDKPGKPHAFTVSSAADPIHAVIPVAGTDQGKHMRYETIVMRRGPDAGVEEGRGVSADVKLRLAVASIGRRRWERLTWKGRGG